MECRICMNLALMVNLPRSELGRESSLKLLPSHNPSEPLLNAHAGFQALFCRFFIRSCRSNISLALAAALLFKSSSRII